MTDLPLVSHVLSTLVSVLHKTSTHISYSNNELTSYPMQWYVWAVDGRLEYGHYPHITVMLAALACLLLLWMPYTLLLLVMQWLMRKTLSNTYRIAGNFRTVLIFVYFV